MNERFLFRGKRKRNREWITGYYVKLPLPERHIIFDLNGDADYIIPETVGQCTGLIDENDTSIFEGDIIEHESGERHEVTFSCTDFCFGTYFGGKFYCMTAFDLSQFTVIGNIHDNPELIGGN